MEEQSFHTVTDIVSITKQRVKVIFDTEDSLLFFTNEIKKSDIHIGMQMPQTVFLQLKNENVFVKAKRKTLDLLTRSDHSEKELTEKLIRYGFSQEIADRAVSYVKAHRYLDDERYAMNYIEFRSSKKSNRQLRRELLCRGIDSEKIDEMMEERNDSEILQELVSKKICNVTNPDEKAIQRLKNSFYRKGFSFSAIERAFESVLEHMER